VEKGFLDYINNEEKVSFPWTMIDKITPRPSEKVRDALAEIGFKNTEIVQTQRIPILLPLLMLKLQNIWWLKINSPTGVPFPWKRPV